MNNIDPVGFSRGVHGSAGGEKIAVPGDASSGELRGGAPTVVAYTMRMDYVWNTDWFRVNARN